MRYRWSLSFLVSLAGLVAPAEAAASESRGDGEDYAECEVESLEWSYDDNRIPSGPIDSALVLAPGTIKKLRWSLEHKRSDDDAHDRSRQRVEHRPNTTNSSEGAVGEWSVAVGDGTIATIRHRESASKHSVDGHKVDDRVRDVATRGGLLTLVHNDVAHRPSGERLVLTIDLRPSSCSPDPVIPEAPYTVLLAVSALATLGLGTRMARRRALA